MRDIWSFLLQTLTASSAAALLLAVKVMFRDKLSPRWQFAMWGVLGVMLLIPAGLGGRYSLFNWPLLVEVVKSGLTGEFGTLTRVAAPIPLPPLKAPAGAADWLYLIYAAGVIALLARYVISYVRLRRALNKGRRVRSARVKVVAEEYGLPLCPVVVVDGLSTAFICGVFRPVLVLPAGVETDDKVILHELLHLKHKDVVWGWVIALVRCVHWCNPLLWLCADWAGNDLESLCDQRVLERLEGEDRRDYGRILLGMADEKYARAPGTSSASNGGENVRRRIEAIARFKRYPAGMGLASVCVALVLAVPMVVGIRAETVPQGRGNAAFTMSAARSVRCTTPAGAFDAYAKGILTGEIPYWAMCAPLEWQDELAEAYDHGSRQGIDWMMEHSGLASWPNASAGYRIYNLTRLEDGSCEGLLVVMLNYPPEGKAWAGEGAWMAVQSLRAEREGDRWIILPQGEFWATPSDSLTLGTWTSEDLPSRVYEAQWQDFIVQVQWQTSASLCWGAEGGTDLEPKPNGRFDYAYMGSRTQAIFTGDLADGAKYTEIGVSSVPYKNGERPVLNRPGDRMAEMTMPPEVDPGAVLWASGSSNSGESWANGPLDLGGRDVIPLAGGGTTFDWERDGDEIPSRIAADLYLNRELAAELTLLPVEGGAWIDD